MNHPHPPSAPSHAGRGAARAPRKGARRWRPRLSAFERVQLLIVVWVALSAMLNLGAGLQMLPLQDTRGDPVPSTEDVLWVAVVSVYPLVAFLVARRFPLWRDPPRHAAVHVAALAALHGAGWLLAALYPPLHFDWPDYASRSFEFVIYTVFAHGMLYGERYHEKEREELRLRAGMARSDAGRMRARVRALRMDWSPRFLTETLEAIGTLLARDVAAAKRMLLGLSTVLRRTLAHARTETVRLEQEAEFVRDVLRVEAMRRPGLAVEWAMDGDALDARVPHMSLLALVSRALGAAPADAPVRLRIRAEATDAGAALGVDAFGVDAAAVARRARGPADGGMDVHARVMAPDAVRLERICALDAADPADSVAAADAAAPQRPAEAEPEQEADRLIPTAAPRGEGGAATDGDGASASASVPPGAGGRLEAATYASFILFATLLALYAGMAEVSGGAVELKRPVWMYVAGRGLYAALWSASLVATARFLSARFPLRQERWARRLGVHALGALVVSLLNAVAYFPFQWNVVRGGEINIGLTALWEWGDWTAYPLLAGIAHGFIYAREYHAKRVSELRLRSMLWESELSRTEAELQALKAELNPHFLFNALNTVSSLMHTRVDEARRVVAHLSALLERVLESGPLQEVPLREEVEFIRLYVEIEQARFGDALRMAYEVDPATLDARVPHLLLQPLVENAIKHGLRPRGGTGRVTLRARRVKDVLELAVEDDGVGPAHTSVVDGTGTGLANVRQRLRQLYREAQSFELAPRPDGGATARIRIPFSRQPRSVDAAADARLTPQTA